MRVTVGTKLEEDGELYQKFSEFEGKYETQSEALRAAMWEGLEDEGEGNDNERNKTIEQWWKRAGVIGDAGALTLVATLLTLVMIAILPSLPMTFKIAVTLVVSTLLGSIAVAIAAMVTVIILVGSDVPEPEVGRFDIRRLAMQ